MRTMRLGVIGCGRISDVYLHNCTRLFDNLEVVACADLVPELARRRAEEFQIPRAGTVEALLADPDVEIVLNLTSPHAHTEVNLRALEAGKHVYAE
ncbi:MAG TPA: Gfo/Idh/MocA family oxidoreductase, partial [Ardenticatenaceae bacterium]|nr:Gfo/Idh/MocA family oxidoreductase [Ardenticatenaceae bacterium]